MFKEISSIALKFIILWFTSVIIIQTGIYFWDFIENKITQNSDFYYKNWSDKLESSSAITLCMLSVGLYIKLNLPPKNIFLYFLRWGLLYIIFPLAIGLPYIYLSRLAFFNITYICLIFFLTGIFIGLFDLKYKLDLDKK